MALDKIIKNVKRTAMCAGLLFALSGCEKDTSVRIGVKDAQTTSDGRIVYLTKQDYKYNVIHTNFQTGESSVFVYPSDNLPEVNAIQPMRDGGFFCAGTVKSTTTVAKWVHDDKMVGNIQSTGIERRGFLTKVDSSGKIKWTKKFTNRTSSSGPASYLRRGNLSNIRLEDLTSIFDRELVLVGERDRKGYVSQLDLDGNIHWESQYQREPELGPKSQTSRIENVCRSELGGIVFLGINIAKSSHSYQMGDLTLGSFDLMGKLLWEKHYGQGERRKVEGEGGSYTHWRFPDPISLEPTLDNGYIFAARTDYYAWVREKTSGQKVHVDYVNSFIIKTNREGELEWKRNFDWSVNDLMPTRDGGYIVVGEIDKGGGKDLINTLKLNSIGDVEWEVTYKKPYKSNTANSVVALPDGYVVGGCYKDKRMLIELDREGHLN